MSQPNLIPEWSALEAKLQREKKPDLIQLIRELASVSAEAERFLKTRYLARGNSVAAITPYRQIIAKQFSFGPGHNIVTWDFAAVEKAINDYAHSSQGDETGLTELLVTALEMALTFADNLNLQDNDFDSDVTRLAEWCSEQLQSNPSLKRKYKPCLKVVQKKGENLGYYALVELLE